MPLVDPEREFIDFKTSMITVEDPLRFFLFHWDLGFSLTLHVLNERRPRLSQVNARDFEGGWLHTGDLGVTHPDGYCNLAIAHRGRVIS